MKLCELYESPEGWRCRNCDQQPVKLATRFKRYCGQVVQPPSPARRLANFSLAAINHFVAGSPTCSQEQIDARLAICQACPLFIRDKSNPDVGVCGHKECGCNLTNTQRYLNALAWSDKSCPDDPPRWNKL